MTRLIITLFITIAFSACTSTNKSEAQAQQTTDYQSADSTAEYTIVEPEIAMPELNIDDFELDFFKEVAKTNGNSSFTTSPASVRFMLAMIANICDASLKNKIIEALAFDGLSQLNKKVLKDLDCYAEDTTNVKFFIGNSLWFANNQPLELGNKIETLQKYSKAVVETVDFGSVETRKKIESWGSNVTDGNILPHISLNNNNIAFLVFNLFYFEGKWISPFEKTDTYKQTFYMPNGERKVNMMHKNSLGSYYRENNFQAVTRSLYGDNSLILVLPHKDKTPADVFKSFNLSALKRIIDKSKTVDLQLALPKFETSTLLSITEPLERLGIPLLPTQFKTIGIQNTDIVSSGQIAKMKVDESGAQAIAETFIMIGSISIEDKPVYEKIKVTFDRPFIYLLRNDKTKSILMAGIYAGPEE